MLGEVVELDADAAEKLNENLNNPKHKYKAGERFYQGGLLPRDGAFWDVPTNMTAEQYLSILDWEEEQFEMQLQGDNCPVCGQPMPMTGQGQGQQSQAGQQSQSQSGQQEGQDNQNGQQGSEQGQESDQDGKQGKQDKQGQAGQQNQDGQAGQQAQAGQQSGQAGQQGSSQGDQDGQGNQGNTCPCCGQNVGQGQGQGQGSGQGSGGTGTGQGTGSGQGTGTGAGGGGGSAGTATGTRTRIFQRHADGSVTELGEDAWVDQIDIDPQSDVWQKVSEMGINPITRGEEQHVREQLAHDIEEYRRSNQYGRGAGDMVLNYVQKGLRPPVVDWRSMLRRIVSRSCQETTRGREDFTWKRISRRHSQGEFISPGQQAYLPKIRFAIDTSGSMSEKEYTKALAEAEGVIRASHRAQMEAVSVDWDAYEIHKVSSVKEIVSKLRGGGGTDMG
ncbi:MAG: hypothetical protein BZ138_06440, partial [Methanosphaera sp. rholeuAM270]